MWSAFMPQLREHIEHLAFEGMVRPSNPNLRWHVSAVGSLS
jgi:hypothetical protein